MLFQHVYLMNVVGDSLAIYVVFCYFSKLILLHFLVDDITHFKMHKYHKKQRF